MRYTPPKNRTAAVAASRCGVDVREFDVAVGSVCDCGECVRCSHRWCSLGDFDEVELCDGSSVSVSFLRLGFAADYCGDVCIHRCMVCDALVWHCAVCGVVS